MAYLKIYKNWLPYAMMKDKRGFISKQFGNGHSGVDSVGNEGNNKVCAVCDGIVLSVKYSSSLGNCVEYGTENFKVAYYHLKEVCVSKGDEVKACKTIIGIEGKTGSLASGKHLHCSVWIDGELVDGEPYLCGDKTIMTGGKTMVRKVIREDLNLRENAGTQYAVKGKIPIASLINITETKAVGSAVWGKCECVINGKNLVGWCNIGDKWSETYTGCICYAVAEVELKKALSKIDEIKKIIE